MMGKSISVPLPPSLTVGDADSSSPSEQNKTPLRTPPDSDVRTMDLTRAAQVGLTPDDLPSTTHFYVGCFLTGPSDPQDQRTVCVAPGANYNQIDAVFPRFTQASITITGGGSQVSESLADRKVDADVYTYYKKVESPLDKHEKDRGLFRRFEVKLSADNSNTYATGTLFVDKHSWNKPQWISMYYNGKTCGSLCVVAGSDGLNAKEAVSAVDVDPLHSTQREEKSARAWNRKHNNFHVKMNMARRPAVNRSDFRTDIFVFEDGVVTPEASVYSTDGLKRAVFQTDGNLVVYHRYSTNSNWFHVWASWTHGSGANKLVNQGDNNLVIYNDWGPVWWSGTSGWYTNPYEPLWCGIQEDGNLVYYVSQPNDPLSVSIVVWHANCPM